MATWRDDIVAAFRGLSGQATLTQIYDAVRDIRAQPLPKYWREIVRKNIEYHSSDSQAYQEKQDIFRSVNGIGKGLWALRGYRATKVPSETRRAKRKGGKKGQGRPKPWEVRMVKAMILRGDFIDQEIQAYFTRPGRTINHARILEIRKGMKHKRVTPASKDNLDSFLAYWPDIDRETGEPRVQIERLQKAREAMLLAVQSYNNPIAKFRSEIFIVSAIIAWTYLVHEFFARKRIDFRYRKNTNGRQKLVKTKEGAQKYWDLGKSLRSHECPFSKGTIDNLELLLMVRHEIEHRMTPPIDDYFSSKLFACCVNFNKTIKELFGPEYGLDDHLSFALQFETFSEEQSRTLAGAETLPRNLERAVKKFEANLSDERLNNPEYALRFCFVPMTANRKTMADRVVTYFKTDPKNVEELSEIFLKEVEKPKYRPTDVVEIMQTKGFVNFHLQDHTRLWQKLQAKEPKKGYGIDLLAGTRAKYENWRWYENWLEVVENHCLQNAEKYSQV